MDNGSFGSRFMAFLVMMPVLNLLQFIYFGYSWSSSGAAFDAKSEAWHDEIFAPRVVRA